MTASTLALDTERSTASDSPRHVPYPPETPLRWNGPDWPTSSPSSEPPPYGAALSCASLAFQGASSAPDCILLRLVGHSVGFEPLVHGAGLHLDRNHERCESLGRLEVQRLEYFGESQVPTPVPKREGGQQQDALSARESSSVGFYEFDRFERGAAASLQVLEVRLGEQTTAALGALMVVAKHQTRPTHPSSDAQQRTSRFQGSDHSPPHPVELRVPARFIVRPTTPVAHGAPRVPPAIGPVTSTRARAAQ